MMNIHMLTKGDEVTLTLKVVKAEVSDHSYYGEHARYKLVAVEGLEVDGEVAVAEGLEWIEIRQPADGTTVLANAERKAAILAREAEANDDDAITEEDLDGLTVKALKALAEEHDIDLGDATKKADIREAILTA